MSEETVNDDGNFVSTFKMFVQMEDLLDKLKLLDYDKEFVRELRMKPMNRHFFALQTNPGEQFYMFTSLAAWLIRKFGRSFETPQEHDDPNSVISGILEVVRHLGIAIDFPPNKLKPGFGEHIIYVLDRLVDELLKKRQFTWRKPRYPQDDTEEEEVVTGEEAELTLAKVEEELLHDGDESDDEDDGEQRFVGTTGADSSLLAGIHKAEIMGPAVQNLEWKLELERVLPQLKVTVQNDSKDWRSHIDEMRTLRDGIEKSVTAASTQLEKLQIDIDSTLEKINSREKYLNANLEGLMRNFRVLQDQLAQTKEQYKQVSGGVTERLRTLAEVTEELESVKQELDEKGSSMTDGSPLVNIKKMLSKLKNEIVAMDVRIAVVEHTLLQAKLRDKNELQRSLSASIASTPFITDIY